jgi:protein-S-isoprenylcysteine O-methyltransferase Ste14
MAAYFLVFASVHSLLADPRFKRWAKERACGALDRWGRLAFNLLALIMLLPFVFILLYLPDEVIYIAPWPAFGLMAAAQLMAAAMLLITLFQTGVLDFLGLEGLLRPGGEKILVTSGFYCHLRNPLFLFAILFLWSSPIMTMNLLTFNIMATFYFYLGALHEERSLKEEFGKAYEEYRRRVPMFRPRFRCEE